MNQDGIERVKLEADEEARAYIEQLEREVVALSIRLSYYGGWPIDFWWNGDVYSGTVKSITLHANGQKEHKVVAHTDSGRKILFESVPQSAFFVDYTKMEGI